MTHKTTTALADPGGDQPKPEAVSVGLISDITQVLDMHGITVYGLSEHAEVLAALHHIVDAVAIERGGRRQP
jgi:hypothetical protein